MMSSNDSQRWRTLTACLAALTLAACGGSEDPFAAADGGNNNGGADSAPASNADARVTDAGTVSCAPTPSRLIVLGDSVAACSTVSGGVGSANCSATMVYEHLKATVNPQLTYENVAVPGAVTEDIPNDQIGDVSPAPGHALVLIFVGGNDLQPYIFISDSAATSRYATDEPRLKLEWDRIYAWLENPSNFPDGVTLMMSTQYNPFDDCTSSPYNLSQYKTGLLSDFNQTLTEQANAREYAIITNQHTSFLGHGHHYQVQECPHFQASSEGWMQDLIHPNNAGHANLAKNWNTTADAIYGSCD